MKLTGPVPNQNDPNTDGVEAERMSAYVRPAAALVRLAIAAHAKADNENAYYRGCYVNFRSVLIVSA